MPKNLAKGIFVPDKTYSAWIRFSNASGDATQADDKKDARGMAIKILGVSGKKILENDDQAPFPMLSPSRLWWVWRWRRGRFGSASRRHD